MAPGNPPPEPLDEFRVVIRADGNEVLVEAEAEGVRVPPTRFPVPFTPEEVGRALSDYSPSRLASDPLASVGATLFNAVFAAGVGRAFWERAADGERRRRGLRLRVVTNVERVQHLPWELLFDPSRGDFMSLSGRLTLVRRRPDGYDDPEPGEQPLAPLPRLRVLAAEADVTGTMDTAADLARLRALAEAHPDRLVLTEVPGATPESLEAALRARRYDVFHFAGTGAVLAQESKRGALKQELRLLGGRTGAGAALHRRTLADMLDRAGVRLAMLNACNTEWVARSLARKLPAAIGFRESVRVDSCLTLVDAFYRAVLAGEPIDLAVTATRQALDRAQPGSGDWCRVICYLQAGDGAFLLEPALAPGGLADGASTAPADVTPGAGPSKEAVKLARLHEIYARNLAALEQMAVGASAMHDDAYRSQADELRQRVEDVRQRLESARAGG